MKKYNTSVFIFRRDLRLVDNTGLIKSLQESKNVIPLFIFTPTQVSNKNKYKSSNSIQFMVDSLFDLNLQIREINKKCRLWTTYDDEINALQTLHKKIGIDCVYINEDYTPYAVKRDNSIENFCKKNKIDFSATTDLLILGTQEIYASNGNAYKIFTQFYKKTIKNSIAKPNYDLGSNFLAPIPGFKKWNIKTIDELLLQKKYYEINDNIALGGGRTNGLDILNHIDKFKNYTKCHDQLSYQTTMLSAHNKFGTVSVREVYWAFRQKAKNVNLVKQLYWRDFYYYIATHFFDEFFNYEHLTRPINRAVKWNENQEYLEAWKTGTTGFPVVDAAMRQMNQTGFMHNRGRLIVAEFFTKDLLLNWKYGEEYFSQSLVDIDRIQNLGNWNWASSFGLDATPFLRIFNPWSQSKTYDAKCKYIKKWIPELADVENAHIHQWDKYYKNYPDVDYPPPIVKHDEQRKKFINFYNKYYRS